MKWIGLTGGIGTGKSTVAEMIRSQGYPVIDADQMARAAVAMGTPGYQAMVQLLGAQILDDKGEIQRKKVAALIFTDPQLRGQLERIVHPIVQARVRQTREEHERAGVALAFYDVPLLFENKLKPQFDAVIVVNCSPEAQLKRLMNRSSLTEDEARVRIDAQLPLKEKVQAADFVINNEGTRAELEPQVREVLAKLRGG